MPDIAAMMRPCPPAPPLYAPRHVSEVHWKGTPFKRQLRKWKQEFSERQTAKKSARDAEFADYYARHANCRSGCSAWKGGYDG